MLRVFSTNGTIFLDRWIQVETLEVQRHVYCANSNLTFTGVSKEEGMCAYFFKEQ